MINLEYSFFLKAIQLLLQRLEFPDKQISFKQPRIQLLLGITVQLPVTL